MNTEKILKLAEEWANSGITSGDTLLLHSNITRTLRRTSAKGNRTTPEEIIASFLSVLGEEGTLVLPLFNFEFTKGIPFDIRNTPSQMGVLTEAGRLWQGAVRTGHPIYSFVAIGKKAALFSGVDNFSGYGSDSPFAIIHQLDAKIGSLDLPDQHSMTFYHYVEECCNVDYRYHKKFTGEYIDQNGVSENKTYGLFVRNIERGVITHVNPMGEKLWEKSIYSGSRPGEGNGLRTLSAKKLFSEVENVIRNGEAKGLLYDIQK